MLRRAQKQTRWQSENWVFAYFSKSIHYIFLNFCMKLEDMVDRKQPFSKIRIFPIWQHFTHTNPLFVNISKPVWPILLIFDRKVSNNKQNKYIYPFLSLCTFPAILKLDYSFFPGIHSCLACLFIYLFYECCYMIDLSVCNILLSIGVLFWHPTNWPDSSTQFPSHGLSQPAAKHFSKIQKNPAEPICREWGSNQNPPCYKGIKIFGTFGN